MSVRQIKGPMTSSQRMGLAFITGETREGKFEWNRGWWSHARGEACPEHNAHPDKIDAAVAGWQCRNDHFEFGSPKGKPMKGRPE